MPSTGQDADWRHLGAGITAGELAGEAAGNRHATDPNGAGRVGVGLSRPSHGGLDSSSPRITPCGARPEPS
jgi:hypothetical protein